MNACPKIARQDPIDLGRRDRHGRRLVEAIRGRGAKIGVVDRKEEAGRAVVAEIERAGGTAMFAAADVADEAQVNAAVADVTRALGPPNVLFNHAGPSSSSPSLRPRSRSGNG